MNYQQKDKEFWIAHPQQHRNDAYNVADYNLQHYEKLPTVLENFKTRGYERVISYNAYNQLKKRVEELEKLIERERLTRDNLDATSYALNGSFKAENQKLKTQVAEMREALEKWLEWEKGQVKKYGRYCQKEINDLIDAGNKVLQKHKESE